MDSGVKRTSSGITAIHSGMAILSTENYKIHRFIKMFRAMEPIALCHLPNYAAGLRFCIQILYATKHNKRRNQSGL